MSLEDQVARLANAVAMHDDVAVREIIRQRDAAMKERDEQRKEAAYYRERTDYWYGRMQQEQRGNRALRGVITKMRRRA